MTLISTQSLAALNVQPRYTPERFGAGIVHLGVGAFHRAHQAVYTDDALAAEGGDWRIIAVSLRSTEIVDALNAQDGLYSVLERSERGTEASVIASIKTAIAARREPARLLHALADPATRIVSLTVTEKAYGIDRATLTVQESHPAIAADLAAPQTPQGAIGFLVEGLRQRREAGTAPFTVLCCDNLPENGPLVRAGVLDFARRIDAGLAAWIDEHVAFPATMVDRITPASTDETRADAARLLGAEDAATVETEPFRQWVIEDRFPSGRPRWEAGGAIFTDDVGPYETMKLTMLNGTHSLIAYSAHVAGLTFVRDAMADPGLARLVRRHLAAAAATLRPLAGIDFRAYANELADRFANPAIAHQTYQIAMDGTEKLPQRLLAPAAGVVRAGGSVRSFAFAVAAWMRYCLGRTDAGDAYALRDPREAELTAIAARNSDDAAALVDAFHALPGLFPEELATNAAWHADVTQALATMLRDGMRQAIDEEAV